MDRYSNIYGTVGGGSYSPMGASANLPAFLNKIGAVNPTATIEAVRNTLAGFPKMDASAAGFKDNYFSQPKNDLPVAVRYAPMHLYKKPGMPRTMQAFCALSVNGNENKQADRVTTYSQTFYIAREHMHEAVTVKAGGADKTFNYLDQIFGTHLLTHEEMGDHRESRVTVDYDALPEKVTPRMRLQDMALVFNTVSTVFDEKTVVIRLEKGCAFNSRAWEILIPIYSLMPPRLAAETGFATYQDPNAIRAMAAETSIRIFLIPAECELKAVEGGDILVIDLNDPKTVPPMPKDDLAKMLNRWNKLSWDLRQPAMEKIFADTAATFNDKALFIQRSREFFDDPFFKWERSDEDRGAIATLEALEKKYNAYPICAQIPWVKDRFVKKIPSLLPKGTTLSQLTADALALALYSKDENEKKHAQQMYRFAMELAGADSIASAKSAGKLVRTQTLDETAPTLAKAIADGEAAVAAEKERTAQAVAAGQAAVAAEKENTAKAVEAGKTAVAKIRADGEAALTAEKTAHQSTRNDLAAEQQNHAATRQALSAEEQKSAGLEQQLQTTQQQLTDANQRIEKAKVAYTELKQEAAGYKSQIDTAKAEAAKAVSAAKGKLAEAEAAKADADKACADAEAARAKADKTIQENNKRMVIFAAAGFLVAALIFGVILLVMGLGGDKDAEPSTEPSASTEMTTEATEPSTEETTEATEPSTEETTEATEPEIPDLTDWSDDTAALWLTEQIPGISEITLEPTGIPEELEALEGYTAVATIQMADEESYAVLMSAADADETTADVEMVPMEDETEPADETEEPTDGTDPTGETDPTDETDPTGESDTQEPAEETAPAAVQVEGASLVLTSHDFLLVVYGNDAAMETALEIFAAMLEETSPAVTSWSITETPWDLDTLLGQLLENEQWWRSVSAVSTDADALTQSQTLLATEAAPALYLNCDGTTVLVYEELMSFQAKDLAEALTEAGHTVVVQDSLVAVIPGE